MATKKVTSKKGSFALTPISLSVPVKPTDGFTNLVDPVKADPELTPEVSKAEENERNHEYQYRAKDEIVEEEIFSRSITKKAKEDESEKIENIAVSGKSKVETLRIGEQELLRFLEADSLDDIYELSDVLRASSLKLYATLNQIADERGRVRVKNHELMSKAGIKGIATLYKQERWLIDLKLLEKKAKPGPHEGSSYVVYKLETLPLPTEIFEKFKRYLADFNS